MHVSRETEDRLAEYEALILSWNRRINLVGASEPRILRHRHLEDCIQIADLIDPTVTHVVDLGSGAGLPGLVIAICCPALHVVCIESDRRKAAFLHTAIRKLGLNAEVRVERIEAVPPLKAPVVTARALAPLARLLDYAARHLAPDGTALFMKGRRWKEELEPACTAWHFSVEAASSRTDPNAVILSIGGLRPCLT